MIAYEITIRKSQGRVLRAGPYPPQQPYMTHHPLGSLPIDEQPMRGPVQLGDPEKMRCLYCQQTLYVRDRRLETCWKAAE